jgi:hypothetical protein
VELLKRKVIEMGRADKKRLAQWMLNGKRSFTAVERLWVQYSQLPQPQQEEVREALSRALD